MPRQSEISYLQQALVIDEDIGRLHIAMENVLVVEITEASQKLQEITLDLPFFEMHRWILQKA
jgi:hypothetical protein